MMSPPRESAALTFGTSLVAANAEAQL